MMLLIEKNSVYEKMDVVQKQAERDCMWISVVPAHCTYKSID